MVNQAIFNDETFSGVNSQILHFINSNKLNIEHCIITITDVVIQGTYINDKPKTKFIGALYYEKRSGIVET